MKNFNKILTLILSIYNVIYNVNSMEDKEYETDNGLGSHLLAYDKKCCTDLVNRNINNEETQIKTENNNTQSKTKENTIQFMLDYNIRNNTKSSGLITNNILEDNNININLNSNKELNKQDLNDSIGTYKNMLNNINDAEIDELKSLKKDKEIYSNLLKKYYDVTKQLDCSTRFLQVLNKKNKGQISLYDSIIDKGNNMTIYDIKSIIDGASVMQIVFNQYENSKKLVLELSAMCCDYIYLIYKYAKQLINKPNSNIMYNAQQYFTNYKIACYNYLAIESQFSDFVKANSNRRKQYVEYINNHKVFIGNIIKDCSEHKIRLNKLVGEEACYNELLIKWQKYYLKCNEKIWLLENHGSVERNAFNSNEQYSIEDIIIKTNCYINIIQRWKQQ